MDTEQEINTEQELFNAIYSGPFVTLAKAEFSNSRNSNIQKWSSVFDIPELIYHFRPEILPENFFKNKYIKSLILCQSRQ